MGSLSIAGGGRDRCAGPVTAMRIPAPHESAMHKKPTIPLRSGRGNKRATASPADAHQTGGNGAPVVETTGS